jgi:lysine-specific demethylase 3
MDALPIPNYTRRDGVLNLASHFATNAVAPDLGKQMCLLYMIMTNLHFKARKCTTHL